MLIGIGGYGADPGTPALPPPGGGQVFLAKLREFYGTTTGKVVLGLGALAGVALLVKLSKKRSYRPNPGKTVRKSRKLKTRAKFEKDRSAARRKRLKAAARKTCKKAPSVPSCRCEAPKKYRRQGATKRSHYAFPECFMYPIKTRKHVRSAASKFAKFGDNIPSRYRGKVRKRITGAKKRFRIGEYRE